MLKKASEVIASGDLKQVVDFAIETYRTIDGSCEELEVCKGFLREEARKVSGPKSSCVLLEGNLGAAQVVFPKPLPRVRRGVDLLASEEGLPPGVFRTLFTKRVVIEFVEDFEEKFATLSSSERAVIDNLVEVVPSTPRVSLPK
jgi:hypothetical protein